MKKFAALLCLCLMATLLGGCGSPDPSQAPATPESASQREAELLSLTQTICDELSRGDYAAVTQRLDESLTDQLTDADLAEGWQDSLDSMGGFKAFGETTVTETAKGWFSETPIECGAGTLLLQLGFTENNALTMIYISVSQTPEATPIDAVLPDTLQEQGVTLSADPDYPLEGTLTLPKDAMSPLPAVILVHGSGPCDRDETVGANKPFRDLAWGLAQQGMAVLRYDKRTYTYGDVLEQSDLSEFTVQQETMDDALAAARLLRENDAIDPERVYILGHSMGAMLAPSIDEKGSFAGIIMLAAPARPMWEVSYEQNLALLDGLSEEETREQRELLQAELEKGRELAAMSDAEAKKETLFGMCAYYFKNMDTHLPAAILKDIQKPVLLLQGEEDFQVSPENDFTVFEDLAKTNAYLETKRYPGLNHLFMPSNGSKTVAEYSVPSQMDKTVIQDIAYFINTH